MSNILLVFPEEWTEVPKEVVDQIGAIQLGQWHAMADFTSIGNALAEYGYPGQITEVTFINSEILAVK